jgi:hypothetical protein
MNDASLNGARERMKKGTVEDERENFTRKKRRENPTLFA